MAKSWLDNEPGWAEARTILASVRRVVRVRWLRTLIVALTATALVVAYRARKQTLFEASVVLRASEANIDPETAPPTSSRLQDYLWNTAFTRHNLLSVMEEFKLYRRERHLDPNLALEIMRDDIELAVICNYFGQQRFSEDPPRTARVVITYAGRSPDKALETVRRLGQLVTAQQAASRQEAAEKVSETADRAVSELTARLLRERTEEATLRYAMGHGDSASVAARTVKLRSVIQNIQDLESQLQIAQSHASVLKLRSDLEQKQMGLRFELVDPGKRPRIGFTKIDKLAVLGFVAFLFLLPVVGIGVGSFDSRVYDANGLRRLGMQPFGHIPAFDGDRFASFDSRRKPKSRPPKP